MNVGFVVYGSLGERSGGFRYDRKLVAGLRAAGDTVEVIELPWRRYPRGLLDNVTPGFADRLDPNATAEGDRDGDLDLLLQDELAHPSLVLPNRRLSVPVVSVVHHLRASERRRLAPLYRAVEARYLDGVDAAICNSRATLSSVTAVSDLGPETTLVAPPAGDRFDPDVDPAAIAARAADGPLRVVFVGNITPRKGLTTLVDGLARVDAAWELTVVGRPVDRAYLERVRRTVRTAGLGDRVRFAGELTDRDLASTLGESHLLAAPSQYEGFGIAALEAMSFGLPAVVTAAGGPRELVADGETGFVVDPDDADAVASAVHALATDRDRLAAMGLAASRRYERHPNWDHTVDRVRSFLSALLEGDPTDRANSADPTNSADSTDSTNPTNPADPTNPEDSTDQVGPEDSTSPRHLSGRIDTSDGVRP